MRRIIFVLVMVWGTGLGCGTTGTEAPASTSSSPSSGPSRTLDGLIEVETSAPGRLFLRENHGIGGYDAIAIAPSFVNYRRTSNRLDPDDEELYLVSLEQSIIDIAESANVRIVDEIGECVIKVGAGFINIDLARSPSAKILGRMTLVILYQDSLSGQSLLRYSADESIERESEGMSREEQIADTFDRMIEDVDIIATLRAATAVPSKPRAGCSGTLVGAGPSAVAAE